MTDPVRLAFRPALQEHFAYLIARYGFAFVADLDERGGEYQMQVAASPACQIKFILELDFFDLSFGRLDAARTWDADGEPDPAWHPLARLVMFEDSIHPEQAFRLPPSPEDTLDQTLARYAALLRPYLPRLIDAFSPDPPAGWWPAYQAWCATVLASPTASAVR